jgi:Trk K+ transport system NAD-binding subunit
MVIDELTLPADASAVGKTLAELKVPKTAHVMAIISAGEVVVPKGDTVLRAGDEVLILSESGKETGLRETFGVHPEPL